MLLLSLTLGNPRQECRQFGICRIELWDGTPPKAQQCIAQAEVNEGQLSLSFLTAYLRPQLRQQHFEPHFLVEAPRSLPGFMGLPGWAVLPGRYEVEVGEESLNIHLKLSSPSIITPTPTTL